MEDMTDLALARHYMVENQLRTNKIDEPRLVAALSTIPRELFLPKRLRRVAYIDDDIDLGNGRHLIEPLALAKMLQASAPRAGEVALVVGCGTGYSSAVMARLVATVFHLVADESEVATVKSLMEEAGCDNVVVQVAAAGEGLPAQAPFGVILLAGSVPAVPEKLASQLEEGGRLACIVASGYNGKVTIRKRVGETAGDLTPFDAWIPRLEALQARAGFAF